MISFIIFLLLWLPLVPLSLPIVALMLLTKWDGRNTWFGNYIHGRNGNHHTPANPNLFEQWWFLAIRNPISNFGKFTLARSADDPDVWLESKQWWRFGVLYGWKYPDPRLPHNKRPFVFRPWVQWHGTVK